jgi:hypothetical protein
MIIFDKRYDGESIVDAGRDVSEAFDETFNEFAKGIPQDEHGLQKGIFRITIEWEDK